MAANQRPKKYELSVDGRYVSLMAGQGFARTVGEVEDVLCRVGLADKQVWTVECVRELRGSCGKQKTVCPRQGWTSERFSRYAQSAMTAMGGESGASSAASAEKDGGEAKATEQETVAKAEEKVQEAKTKAKEEQWVVCKLGLCDESGDKQKQPTVSVTPIRSQKRYKLLGMDKKETQTGAMELGVKHDVLLSDCAVLTALVTYFVERHKKTGGAKRGKVTRYALHLQASRCLWDELGSAPKEFVSVDDFDDVRLVTHEGSSDISLKVYNATIKFVLLHVREYNREVLHDAFDEVMRYIQKQKSDSVDVLDWCSFVGTECRGMHAKKIVKLFQSRRLQQANGYTWLQGTPQARARVETQTHAWVQWHYYGQGGPQLDWEAREALRCWNIVSCFSGGVSILTRGRIWLTALRKSHRVAQVDAVVVASTVSTRECKDIAVAFQSANGSTRKVEVATLIELCANGNTWARWCKKKVCVVVLSQQMPSWELYYFLTLVQRCKSWPAQVFVIVCIYARVWGLHAGSSVGFLQGLWDMRTRSTQSDMFLPNVTKLRECFCVAQLSTDSIVWSTCENFSGEPALLKTNDLVYVCGAHVVDAALKYHCVLAKVKCACSTQTMKSATGDRKYQRLVLVDRFAPVSSSCLRMSRDCLKFARGSVTWDGTQWLYPVDADAKRVHRRTVFSCVGALPSINTMFCVPQVSLALGDSTPKDTFAECISAAMCSALPVRVSAEDYATILSLAQVIVK